MLSRPAIRIDLDPATATHDALWLADPRFPLPAGLAEEGVAAAEGHTVPSRAEPAVYFRPLPLDTLATAVKAARADLGDDAYVVAVTPATIAPAWARRLLSIGADDVASLGDADSLIGALIRGRRHVQRLREHLIARRRAEAERQRFEACIDVLPLPIFFKDRQGAYWCCNRAFADYIGRPVTEILGKTVHEVAPLNLASVNDAVDQRLHRSKGTEIYESQIRSADGTIRDVVFHKAAILDDRSEVSGITCAVIDVTDRRDLERRLQDIADRDPLTGAYNRRKFFELAEGSARRAAAADRPLSVMVIDVDHFKQLNDRHGHSSGDVALCQVVGLLDRHLSPKGFHARVGGEEFFAVLDGTSLEAAAEHAEALRSAMANAMFRCRGADVRITISIGVAEFDSCQPLAMTLERADRALYRAKRNGRNRIEIARRDD